MDCAGVRRYLDAYAAGELSGRRRQDVAEHLENCTRCTEEVRDYAEARETLLAAGRSAVLPGPGFFTGLSSRLDEVDKRTGRTAAHRPVRWHVVSGAAAVAAAVLVIAAYLVPVYVMPPGPEPSMATAIDDGQEPSQTALAAAEEGAGVSPRRMPVLEPGIYTPRSYNVPVTPYSTVSTQDAGGRSFFGPSQPMPRFTFPRQMIEGTASSQADSVPVADYEALRARMRALEERIDALERARHAPATP